MHDSDNEKIACPSVTRRNVTQQKTEKALATWPGQAEFVLDSIVKLKITINALALQD